MTMEGGVSMTRVVSTWIVMAMLLTIAPGCSREPAPATAADPLPSWNDGAAKQSILEFVSRVTREGGPDFVPPAERIATFDNDGTLWSEKPLPFQMRSRSTASRRWPRTSGVEDQTAICFAPQGGHGGLAASGEKGLLLDHGRHAHGHDDR